MCELTTAVMIASAGIGAYGAYSQAQSQKAAAKAQSQIAANNAIINEQNAKYQDQNAQAAAERGQAAAMTRRRQILQLEGSQRTGFAGAGVALDSGSPLDVFNDTVTFGDQDVKTIQKNSEQEQLGYRMNAYNYRASGAQRAAESSMYAAKADSINPWLEAGSSALSSASTISSKWDSFTSNSASNYYSSGVYNPGTYNPQAAANGLPWSDIRLKHSVEKVGERFGIPIYEFEYVGNTMPGRFRGVMAEDVEHIAGAVVERGGFKSVNYPALGLEFCEVAGNG